MKPNYSDITSRLGEPLWWDENGVPRYEAFHPSLCDVYADYAALMIVTCQACGRQFNVAVTRREYVESFEQGCLKLTPTTLPTVEDAGHFYYGDPPRHKTGPTESGECLAGDTMTSDPRQILEFWQQEDWEWKRKPELEFEFHIPRIEEWDQVCGFDWKKTSEWKEKKE